MGDFKIKTSALQAPVLVVDDESITGDLAAAILHRMGFTDVTYTDTCAKAFELLHSRAHSLIVSDIRMEPIDGLKLLRAIRATPLTRSAKVLMMTATIDTALVTAAVRAGMDGYILKPFTPQAFRIKVAEILSK